MSCNVTPKVDFTPGMQSLCLWDFVLRPSLCKTLSGSLLLLALIHNLALGASVEITASRSIKLPVLVYLETPSTESNITRDKDTKQAKITSTLSTFEPQLQVLPVGTVIEIINADPILHNTHVFDHGRTLFNIATPNPGVTVRYRLTRPGLFNVRCDLHPFMNAWIAVVSSSYYTVIEKAGVYKINNIEPGQYKLHIHRPGRPEKILSLDLALEELKKIQLFPTIIQ